MPIETVDECVAEAIRLLAEASKAASDDERLRLLWRAAAWLQLAKQRAGEAHEATVLSLALKEAAPRSAQPLLALSCAARENKMAFLLGHRADVTFGGGWRRGLERGAHPLRISWDDRGAPFQPHSALRAFAL
jgi:hypothetical protein